MAQNPDIKIEILNTSSGEYGQKMTAMYATNSGLDVIEVGLGAALYASQGMLLDLKPYLQKDKEVSMDMWPQPVLDGFSYEGMIWGLPVSIDLWMNWFNKDLFDKAGVLDPQALGTKWTWDTLLQAAKKLTVDTNADGRMDQYSPRSGLHLLVVWYCVASRWRPAL